MTEDYLGTQIINRYRKEFYSMTLLQICVLILLLPKHNAWIAPTESVKFSKDATGLNFPNYFNVPDGH